MTKSRVEFGKKGAVWLGLLCCCFLYTGHAEEIQKNAEVKAEKIIYKKTGKKEVQTLTQETAERKEIDKEHENGQKAEKIAYLTFDDGPSTHSEKLLDILAEEGVKATFFVVGKEDEQSKEIYKQILAQGHSLGLHSYSHVYNQIYASADAFAQDVWKLKTYLYHVTGESCDIYRFPGGSTTSKIKFPLEKGVDFLNSKGIRYFDWNATAEDAVCVQSAPSVLLTRVLKDALKYDKPIILMHDLNCCETTVRAVKPLIARLRKEGYAFDCLTREAEGL